MTLPSFDILCLSGSFTLSVAYLLPTSDAMHAVTLGAAFLLSWLLLQSARLASAIPYIPDIDER